ncbi:Zn-dependent protease (includes SpoIVFB) [Parafrankia irregularis]|uniref:Zn-dependent protease (Includes SpoIVFB) n=1 Tax=Parafrankia irregularis TaxID=795642 RepID=A0A0S4QJR0_9ACTN|nr:MULTISPECIES: peptidase M50 [Parafrankia]MBE3202082.1 peptidase M50 [Parafrankia sp. CH37]CUU55861.1 Zn-dependent protease (includes SpoIVFB) [Parafrankia irregularis]
MFAKTGPRDTAHTPIAVRPGLFVSVTIVTVVLAAFTLPATAPDRPGFAYFSGGVIGAGLLVVLLLAADLARAAAARRAGIKVVGITLGAFGSRLVLAPAQRSGVSNGPGTSEPLTPGTDDPAADAAIARAGLTVTALVGVVLVAAGALAPAGTLKLLGEVALWVGTFALLITVVDLLPAPRSAGGRILAARVVRRTGDKAAAAAAVARAGVITGWTLIALGVVAVLLIGLVGLWAVLLGWLALGSSRVAQAQQKATTALSGVFVRDVMVPAPPSLQAWKTVGSALEETVIPSGGSVFAVRDFAGPLLGVVLLRDLAAVPADDRGLARVTRVAIPLDRVAVARPDEPLASVTSRLAQRPAAGVIVVVESGADGGQEMVGTVGPGEIARALEASPLHGRVVSPVGFGRRR